MPQDCFVALLLAMTVLRTFLRRKEKYQKKHALQLGLWLAAPQAWLPSRKRFFRRGPELACFAVLKQPARFFPKQAFALGCAATGGEMRYCSFPCVLTHCL
ncbi:MAG: hypothetical protein SWC96_04245 [Thermodesulfobacteriota bacterium]|nr:hypothetical protein [Thermodesulfobacteriota bacterium]